MIRSLRHSLIVLLVVAAFAGPAVAYAEEAADAGSSAGTEDSATAADTMAVGDIGDGENPQAESSSAPHSVSISDLTDIDDGLDGKMVTVRGEAVGEAVYADEGHRWISLVQDGSAISVYVNAEDASLIQHFGRYGEVGDTVAVSGVFNIDCPDHAGDIDVHVAYMQIESAGTAAVHEVDSMKVYLAIGVVLLGVVLGIVYWRLTERER